MNKESANILLEVENLSISFNNYPVVNDISFYLHKKECLCLVGESGCGKSMTSLAIMQLLPPQAQMQAKNIVFEGQYLLKFSPKQIANIRGNTLAMIFQDPMSALNPVLPLGDQIAEPLIRHKNYTKRKALFEAQMLLTQVGIPDAEARLKEYAHQFSGGMLQRVMIAMMLACRPSLLIADEPTTALDIGTQKQIIKLLKELMQLREMGLLFITHDMKVANELADTIAVMYAGKIVEIAPKDEFFAKAYHPYSRGLLASIPTKKKKNLDRLPTIKGTVPHPSEIISGCRFKNRCPYADQECDAPPPLQSIGNRKILCCKNFKV